MTNEEKLEKKQRSWLYYSTEESDLWSWLGYSKDKEGQHELIEEDSSKKKPSSWMSLFGSSGSDNMDDPTVQPIAQKNAVLPTFKSQFAAKQANLFTRTLNAIKRSLFTTSIGSIEQNIQHKKIVIVGVHGWFPMKLVRSMVGEPTGTSEKFCQQMKTATKNYFLSQHQMEIPDESMITIPLYWEGKVQTRVDKFEQLIQTEWVECLKTADIILWATHSQGTPVSVILMHRLIDAGLIRPHQQPVCMLAMAGISHGPFPSLKENLLVKYFEADAARELFEFMDSESDISRSYRDSMAFLLNNQIKMVLVGSMQDQVVPLYSALMSGLTHPNLLHAIFIDSHIYSQDDFLIRLIAFTLQLLNLGLSDHGFLIHISEVLAGSLYSMGHSTLYEELDVFTLSIQYIFQDTQHSFGKAKLESFQAKPKLNPFHLPWVVRGIWQDPRILKDQELHNQLQQLQVLFDRWQPTSTRLKEIKFRLEPLKARL